MDQSDAANWTLLPECCAAVQSEENAWKTTECVSRFNQSEAAIAWRGTGKLLQSLHFTGVRSEAAAVEIAVHCQARLFIGPIRMEMLRLSGLSVALVLALVPGEALKDGECEGRSVC